MNPAGKTCSESTGKGIKRGQAGDLRQAQRDTEGSERGLPQGFLADITDRKSVRVSTKSKHVHCALHASPAQEHPEENREKR
jgi:hypothetical protein